MTLRGTLAAGLPLEGVTLLRARSMAQCSSSRVTRLMAAAYG